MTDRQPPGALSPLGGFGIIIARAAVAIGLLYLFLVGISTLEAGIKALGSDFQEGLLESVTNPVAGLFAGMLATVLVQSSSVTTSTLVGLVGSGTLTVEAAAPMIMGANIGTTITNTIVSLGHARRSEEFRRAFAAATMHDFFNILAVLVFFPLELTTGFLTHAAEALADVIARTGIAGGEEEEGQPPGTMHIVLDDGKGVEYAHSRYYQGRAMAKSRSVLQALTLLRRYLMIRSGARIE